MSFEVDFSETRPGSLWFCNACPFEASSHEQATDHAIEAKSRGKFPHMLYERRSRPADGRMADGASRRIATYASGIVQTEKAPAPAARTRKDPAAPTRGRRRRG